MQIKVIYYSLLLTHIRPSLHIKFLSEQNFNLQTCLKYIGSGILKVDSLPQSIKIITNQLILLKKNISVEGSA